MSDVVRRWYASKEALAWDDDAPIAVLYTATERVRGKLRTVRRLACWRRLNIDDAAENAMPTPVDVTRRTLAHIDRLARDFIGHGVTPTWNGGRGVCGESSVAYGVPRNRWLRAENRARRVVVAVGPAVRRR
ncbi:MAG: hypothetical protein EPN91_10745 [Salinibacterium sp.]|nr:MAG: hypothetical protein EPN91_10745 [Salinibacterium sp.]